MAKPSRPPARARTGDRSPDGAEGACGNLRPPHPRCPPAELRFHGSLLDVTAAARRASVVLTKADKPVA